MTTTVKSSNTLKIVTPVEKAFAFFNYLKRTDLDFLAEMKMMDFGFWAASPSLVE